MPPQPALRAALDEFVEHMMRHPAYVRLALVDFATPGGGMDYVKLAAGGSFKENFFGGPLAAMHSRLRKLLQAGVRAGDFRRLDASDVYRVVKASALADPSGVSRTMHCCCGSPTSAAEIRAVQAAGCGTSPPVTSRRAPVQALLKRPAGNHAT